MTLPKWRAVVFVHGCFWHQHPSKRCKLARVPKSRLEFWLPKLRGNRVRDLRVKKQLRRLGWRVLEIWECQISSDRLELLERRIKTSGQGIAVK